MKKLTELTPQQRDRMASFAQEWIQYGWRTQPLTEEEWAVWEAGARKCYEFAGVPWPGVVIRVPSPIVGSFAAPIADFLIRQIRNSGGAVGGAVRGAVRDAVYGAVYGAVGGAVRGAVRDAVGDAVRGAVGGAVYGAVYGAVGDAVDGAVGDAVDGAVRGAVYGAVDDAVQRLWHYRIGGRLWPNWQAYIAFFRDIVELKLPQDIWDRSRAYDAAQSAGWWWPFRDFVMVCDTPLEIHVERVGPDGWGSHRLHREDGSAVRWSDGWGVYAWHGVTVPSWVIEDPSVEKALAERNTEIRRAAFEKIGWDRVIDHLGVKPIDVCPDPANAPHELALYRLPDKANPYGQPVNLLLMVNGSPDRSGDLRRYGETVPPSIKTAIEAAAWQYGMKPGVYQQLARRT